jgi:hypothetical protein
LESSAIKKLEVMGNVSQTDVMKQREDFAVSLRNKKKQEVLTSKRKINMQRAFARTTEDSNHRNNQFKSNLGAN